MPDTLRTMKILGSQGVIGHALWRKDPADWVCIRCDNSVWWLGGIVGRDAPAEIKKHGMTYEWTEEEF